ncbi:MAG TPA: hypothetical protein VMD99_06980 [Terriglobales bacterium]|nr:hypothetical protein [Terriglobales bacterium]
MKRFAAALCLLVITIGCGTSTNNSTSNNGGASLANSSGSYWRSSVIAGNGYYLNLFLNSNGSGQCSYVANSETFGPYSISWQLASGNLALANGSNCLAPMISGVEETGNPVLAFTGTLNDGSDQYPLTFSLQTGNIP